MKLQELLGALNAEMEMAGVSSAGSSATLAFVARRDRDGEVEVDFVDAASMSKPRAEELHHLELHLSSIPRAELAPTDEADGDDHPANPLEGGLFKKGEGLDSPPLLRKAPKPPNLPLRRKS